MRVECPHCGHAGKAPDEYAGRQIKCKTCGKTFTAISVSEPVTKPALNVLHWPRRVWYAMFAVAFAGAVASLSWAYVATNRAAKEKRGADTEAIAAKAVAEERQRVQDEESSRQTSKQKADDASRQVKLANEAKAKIEQAETNQKLMTYALNIDPATDTIEKAKTVLQCDFLLKDGYRAVVVKNFGKVRTAAESVIERAWSDRQQCEAFCLLTQVAMNRNEASSAGLIGKWKDAHDFSESAIHKYKGNSMAYLFHAESCVKLAIAFPQEADSYHKKAESSIRAALALKPTDKDIAKLAHDLMPWKF